MGPPSRLQSQCRAYFRRTLDALCVGLRAWKAIFDKTTPGIDHPWSPRARTCSDLMKSIKTLLSQCPSDIEEEIMAWQSIKKLLPDSCRCMESTMLGDLRAKLLRHPKTLPRGYLSFVRRETEKLFPKGWDGSYERFCLTSAPPLSATMENSRKEGGALAALQHHSYSSFLETVMKGALPLPTELHGKAIVVQSSGKPRPLSKFSSEGFFLRPLHKTIYSWLSTKKWLLRGAPDPQKLTKAGFRFREGKTLVSGDYQSATDNLPIEVMETALDVILSRATSVPANVREFARAACRPFLRFEELDEQITQGQMMGSYLSFPFLCLQNYLAFSWSMRAVAKARDIPLLINGDDILFQTELGNVDNWVRTVGDVGLTVERTKTSVSNAFGTINSTLLRWDDGFLKPVPTVRMGMLRPCEFPHSLGKSFESFVRGFSSKLKWKIGREFFRAHVGELRSCRFTLPSLGFRGSLALRLSDKFGLLDEDRIDAQPPSAPQSHDVVLPNDLVTQVATDGIDKELQLVSSAEVASWKWSFGFKGVDRVSDAIRYAIASTRWSTCPCLAAVREHWDSVRGDWILGGRLAERIPQNKGFFAEAKEKTVRVMTCVFDEACADFGRGPLPPFEEALATTGWWRFIERGMEMSGTVGAETVVGR